MDFTFAHLILPSFIAGVLTFLAPCTLPLVPGYLAFIGGASAIDVRDPAARHRLKASVMRNGIAYVIGFSVVFVVLGSLFGLGGASLIQYRVWLSRIGGVFIVFFGLYMLHVFKARWFGFLNSEHRLNVTRWLTPGKPASSFILGATFAFGWTPCVGPILGAILLLASTTATVATGALLLLVFSAGLGLPFLIVALAIGWFHTHMSAVNKYLKVVSVIGGVFLLFIGILLLTNSFGVWVGFFYRVFNIFNADALLNYL